MASDQPLHNAESWSTLTLTHVEYPTGDQWGKLLALISLTPFAVLVSFATLIVFRRDLHTITFFIGCLVSEAGNFVLKHVIKESRPMKGRQMFVEYGMPSSHSQMMWFLATYIMFFVIFRLHRSNNNSFFETLWKYTVVVGAMVLAFLVSYSRVYLEYHTRWQVICGGGVGASFAVVWFLLTQFVFTPLFPVIVSWPISEFLMLRDTTLIPNVMWFEYTNYRTESRSRQRKLVSMKSQ